MKKIIGIVGGVGPQAGLDMNAKIFEQTLAKTDQEHARVILISFSDMIGDRTEYIRAPESGRNPGEGIADVVEMLAGAGAEWIGVTCNTAYAEPIFSVMKKRVAEKGVQTNILNMIDETVDYLVAEFPSAKTFGLMSTLGTFATGLYQKAAGKRGLEILTPDENGREEVHRAIYDPEFGVKAFFNPVSSRAISIFEDHASGLFEAGAEAVIMGCTEIPLGMTGSDPGRPLVDPTTILARSLLEKAGYPLKPLI